MTLKERLIRLIETGGPIPVSTYMQLALHDRQDGYYATRPGLGRDFITAPETSQVFGELLGLWVVHEWQAMGAPDAFCLVEIGPGRGVLMQDALRMAFVAGGKPFADAMQLVLVEASPALRDVQVERLAIYEPQFAEQASEVPDLPTIILANEYLDCLPARQFRRDGEEWHECVVGLDTDGALAFGLAADGRAGPEGAAQSAACVEVPTDAAPGDSLRAFKDGAQVSPLHAPGETDLTVDVDFGRLKRLAESAGLDVTGPVPQGMFLLGLGAQARLNQLVKANEADGDVIFSAAQRLIDPKDMGERFKAICISTKGLPKPAGF